MRQVFARQRASRIGSLATSLALVASTIALMLSAGAHVLPAGRLAQRGDIVTPLTGHVLIGTAAALAALRFRRVALPLLAGSVVVALVAHAALARAKQVRELWPTNDTAPGDRLRVYELNVWDENPDLPRLERAIEAVDADVVVLAEADRSKLAMIERLKVHYPYQVSCADRRECSMAVLSRLPIVAGQTGRARLESPPIAWARVDASARGIGEVTVIGTHVHRPSRNSWVHAMQMQALAAIVMSAKGPVILAGDFNVGPWSASYQRLLSATGLVATAGLQPTWPAYPIEMPQVALDHILTSPDLIAVRSGLGPGTGSDHLPTFVEVMRRAGVARER